MNPELANAHRLRQQRIGVTAYVCDPSDEMRRWDRGRPIVNTFPQLTEDGSRTIGHRTRVGFSATRKGTSWLYGLLVMESMEQAFNG